VPGAAPAIVAAFEERPDSLVLAGALLRIEGTAAFGRTPRLAAVLRKDLRDSIVVGGAPEGCKMLANAGKSAVPFLIEAIGEDDVRLRVRGARILGRMGPDAASALPALRKLLDDPDDEARREAARAIARIGG